MDGPFPSFKIFNGNVLLMEFETVIDIKHAQLIGQYVKLLKDHFSDSFVDIVGAYHSLTIYLKEDINPDNELVETLKTLYTSITTPTRVDSKFWRIPVVYGGASGPDFYSVCKTLNIDKDELIAKHSAPFYDVHFIGFLPGFPYLGGLDPVLHIARKSVPSASTLAGSVAIGGTQTGIYPVNSPGGWYVIGHTPFPLFDIKRSPPIIIQGQDQIQFFPIQESEIEDYRQQLQNEIAGIYEN